MASPELHIARHAAQAILRHALDAAPEQCCGLLAASGSEVVAVRRIANRAGDPAAGCHPDAGECAAAAKAWQTEGARLCGLYHTSPSGTFPDAAALAAIESELPVRPREGVIHVVVLRDTAGRLEARACRREDALVVEVPLVMDEDSRTIPAAS